MLQTLLEPLMRVAKAHSRGKEEYVQGVVRPRGARGRLPWGCGACLSGKAVTTRAAMPAPPDHINQTTHLTASRAPTPSTQQVTDLLERFGTVEEKFQQAGATEQEMIDALRKAHANNHQARFVAVGRRAGARDPSQCARSVRQ
jgi:hypothetical protein